MVHGMNFLIFQTDFPCKLVFHNRRLAGTFYFILIEAIQRLIIDKSYIIKSKFKI